MPSKYDALALSMKLGALVWSRTCSMCCVSMSDEMRVCREERLAEGVCGYHRYTTRRERSVLVDEEVVSGLQLFYQQQRQEGRVSRETLPGRRGRTNDETRGSRAMQKNNGTISAWPGEKGGSGR